MTKIHLYFIYVTFLFIVLLLHFKCTGQNDTHSQFVRVILEIGGTHRMANTIQANTIQVSSSSQMSALLFLEDRYSSSSDDDAEITLINRQNRSNQTLRHHSAEERPMSMPMTMDYTTQGDLKQTTSPVYINTVQATTQNQFCCTNNFFVPDGSNRCIHEIRDKVFHARYLENGNNAYQLELPGLKDMLHTSRFLMDETSGQSYAVYDNTYQCMSTKPMLEQTWGTGELIDQLAAT